MNTDVASLDAKPRGDATLVAMATVWQMLLHPTLGLVNQVLAQIGGGGRSAPLAS